MRATLEHVDRGTPGVRQKLARLRQLVDGSKLNPHFRRLALDIVRDVREGDTAGELAALSSWVRANVTYRRDPVGVELFTAPDLLASDAAAGAAAGDCDDHVALGAALAEVLGHPSRFAVGGHKLGKDFGSAWSHVWRQTWNGRRWVDFDDTAKTRPPGWSPASRYGLAASAGEGNPATLPRMRNCRKVGVPCVDEFGQLIPGTARLVDFDRLNDAGATFTAGGLGGDELGRIGKRLKKLRKKTLKAAKKVAKKALPIAALAVNVFPGVGQAASVALTAAAAAQKQAQAKKRARQAEQNYAREQAAAMQAEAAAAQAYAQAPIPMPMELPAPQQSGGAVVAIPQAPPMFQAEEVPAPLQEVAPPDYAPAEVFAPAWDDAKDSDALGSFWSSVASGFNAALPIVAGAATTGQLTVGGVSIPLGRDARRLVQPVQRYVQALRPTAPPPSVVTAPPTVLRPTIVPPATRRPRGVTRAGSGNLQTTGGLGVLLAIGAGALLLGGMGRRR